MRKALAERQRVVVRMSRNAALPVRVVRSDLPHCAPSRLEHRTAYADPRTKPCPSRTDSTRFRQEDHAALLTDPLNRALTPRRDLTDWRKREQLCHVDTRRPHGRRLPCITNVTRALEIP